jgi:hypothetical protein
MQLMFRLKEGFVHVEADGEQAHVSRGRVNCENGRGIHTRFDSALNQMRM